MNNLNVLYEDNHIIVVVKPVNVLSQSDNTNDLDLLSIVKDYIKVKYNKPGNVYLGLVHRLDRPVGGVMVFARTSKAASRLSEIIRKNEFNKRYIAVVHGKVPSEGTLNDKILKLDNGNSIVSKDGKDAVLSYKLVEYNKDKDESLVNINLKTGRHHQIRVQFASRNHPLCGDQRYGMKDKTQIALFAYYLSFVHPVTKEKMEFKCLPMFTGYWKDFSFLNRK